MHTTIEAAREALRTAQLDVAADFGENAVNAAHYDLVNAIAADCDTATAAELRRRELGLEPA